MGKCKKSERLGMSHGVARARLLKMILFDLLKQFNKDVCFRCDKKIDKIEELSIEHKKAWLNSENPKQLFFDLENISFSHLSCNSKHSSYPKTSPWKRGEKNNFSKLTVVQVKEIKELVIKGVSLRNIAKQYNVNHTTIGDIKQGKTWNY